MNKYVILVVLMSYIVLNTKAQSDKAIIFQNKTELQNSSAKSRYFVGINTTNNTNQTFCIGSSPVPIASNIETNLETYNNEESGKDYIYVTINIQNPEIGDELIDDTGAGTTTSITKKITYATSSTSSFNSKFQQLINNIKFRCTQSGAGSRSIEIKIRHKNYLPATKHFYTYIPGKHLWQTALNNAETHSYKYGLNKSYLVTITSDIENDFVNNIRNGNRVWLGASDYDEEQKWIWKSGPEKGQELASNLNGMWEIGYPRKWSFFDTILENAYDYASLGEDNKWFDGVSMILYIDGYVVEAGGMPNDLPVQMKQTITIDVNNNSPEPIGIYFTN